MDQTLDLVSPAPSSATTNRHTATSRWTFGDARGRWSAVERADTLIVGLDTNDTDDQE